MVEYICDHASGCPNEGCHWRVPHERVSWTSAKCSTVKKIVIMMPALDDEGQVRPWPDYRKMDTYDLVGEIETHVKALYDFSLQGKMYGKAHMIKVFSRRMYHLWAELGKRDVL